jgi:enoyl-CoA hydratase
LVTLNRPQARNAMNTELIVAVRDAFARIEVDPNIRVAVLTGTDPAFCAGFDLRELSRSGIDVALVFSVEGPFAQLRKPLIGAINGAAFTGGLEMALACDLRIASERAQFGDTHARVGVMPGWGLTARLPRAIGYARALEMSLAGTVVDAEQALAWGLVNKVVAHDDLRAAALQVGHRIAELDPAPAMELLQMYRRAAGRPTSDALTLEGLASQAWLARRGGIAPPPH